MTPGKKRATPRREQTSARFDDREHKRLAAYAQRTGLTVAQVIRMCVIHTLPMMILDEGLDLRQLQAESKLAIDSTMIAYSVPVTFNQRERKRLSEYSTQCGLSQSKVIRMCVLFALPKLMADELNLLKLQRESVLEVPL